MLHLPPNEKHQIALPSSSEDLLLQRRRVLFSLTNLVLPRPKPLVH